MTETEYVPLLEAARVIGITDRTLRKRIRAGELPVFTTGLNRSQRLVRLADLRDLAAPRRLMPSGREVAMPDTAA